ncbi:hypothetical protein [Burkholderia sp. Bp8984]|uniref:hypothetical protein n=1 Tax=Burkholderia sp. Bp8984 TaxID=2184549 RepID=UPI000F590DF2|nr:hypothetical protein [Burkholderia sp. Bp8984]RQS63839.1 hypothetical protein DID98_02860 [Burkholderia sp. Bp8984]
MKKLLALLLFLPLLAWGQCNPFASNQILTASGLNAALSAGCITSGTINGASIGQTTAAAGAFTTLSASSTVSGTGFSTYLASPPAIGGTAANTGSFTTLNSTGGTLNGSIGQTTPAAGTFTTLKGNSLAKVYATNTSAQSIPNSAFTTVTTWTTSFDVNSNFTASTGTFTAPATGYYLVSAGVAWGTMTGAAGVGLALAIFANGTQVATGYLPYPTTSTFGVLPAAVSALVSLTSGQTIVVKAFQNSGGAVALANNANANYLSITQVP